MDTLWNLSAVAQTSSIGDMIRQPRGMFAAGAVVLLVLYGLMVGRTKALISLLSIYVAYVLTVLFPFQTWLSSLAPESASDGMSLGMFLVLYALVFIVLSRALRTRLSLGKISLVQVLLISAVQIGLLASIGVSLLSPELGERLFGAAQPYVSGQRALWAWAAASLAILPFLKSRRR